MSSNTRPRTTRDVDSVAVLARTGVALLYLIVRTAIAQVISPSDYVRFLLTPGKSGRLTPLEQTLRSPGLWQSQIASARDQVVASIEGFAGSVVPLLTGIVGGYMRGQLLLCGLVGVGMQVIGVPYALLRGVLAFILAFIPVLGTLVSGAICVLFALTRGWVIALIVLVYFVVVHAIEGDVVGLRIVGKAVGLHLVASLATLIAGAEPFGTGECSLRRLSQGSSRPCWWPSGRNGA